MPVGLVGLGQGVLYLGDSLFDLVVGQGVLLRGFLKPLQGETGITDHGAAVGVARCQFELRGGVAGGRGRLQGCGLRRGRGGLGRDRADGRGVDTGSRRSALACA